VQRQDPAVKAESKMEKNGSQEDKPKIGVPHPEDKRLIIRAKMHHGRAKYPDHESRGQEGEKIVLELVRVRGIHCYASRTFTDIAIRPVKRKKHPSTSSSCALQMTCARKASWHEAKASGTHGPGPPDAQE